MTSVFMGLCITLCVMSFLMIWIKVDQKRENKKNFLYGLQKNMALQICPGLTRRKSVNA